jgi:hypothetical protein
LQDLNDDCLARALDKLAEKNPKKIISSIILQALSSEDITINVDVENADSSRLS